MTSQPPRSVDADRPPPRLQLAGMALANGVLVIGPSTWAVAVREPDGSITTTRRERPTGGEQMSARVPLLRGPVRLANMLRVLPQARRASPHARLAFESPTMIAATIGSSIAGGILRRRLRSPARSELIGGALSLAVTLASMRAGDVAAYHGAEHKAIGGYEQGIAAARAPREHPRCGTQLALPMIAFSAIGTQAALALAPRHPRSARLAGQLVGIAAATELFRAATRGRGTALARVAARAGTALQTHATTVEPTAAQLEVAEAARDAVLAAEHQAGPPD